MSNVTDIWTARSESSNNVIILPDGCRDLIVKTQDAGPSIWCVSPLFDHSQSIHIQARTSTLGFRLKPGVSVDANKLMAYMLTTRLDLDKLEEMLNDVSHLDACVEETLTGLAGDVTSVMHAASLLGLSTRSLQRLLIKETNKSPSYWFQLARIRKAAKDLTLSSSPIDVADANGFSDQSHMCREFQRWFKMTPTHFANHPEFTDQLTCTGYALD
jgi:AraC-like DNA-binding protein